MTELMAYKGKERKKGEREQTRETERRFADKQ